MNKSDILIVVKTYPEISTRYTETVCTAGILAETKRFVRLYPIRFRYIDGDQRFKKYQWIRAAITKAQNDPRPESYNIDPDSIELRDIIPVGKGWGERCEWILNENTLFPSVEALKAAREEKGTSLGIIQPKSVKKVFIQIRDPKELEQAIAKKDSIVKQLDFFEEKKDLYILPIKISVEFICNDSKCSGHQMSILDWEFGQLYRKLSRSEDWQEKIKSKILDTICGENKDTYIMLGNMVSRPNIFCVLGFFWPPKLQGRQIPLFG